MQEETIFNLFSSSSVVTTANHCRLISNNIRTQIICKLVDVWRDFRICSLKKYSLRFFCLLNWDFGGWNRQQILMKRWSNWNPLTLLLEHWARIFFLSDYPTCILKLGMPVWNWCPDEVFVRNFYNSLTWKLIWLVRLMSDTKELVTPLENSQISHINYIYPG